MVGLVVFIGTGEFVLVACLPGAVCLIASDGLEVFTDIGRASTIRVSILYQGIIVTETIVT